MLLGKDLGPYHIESELGSGAMGSVYGAVRRDTGQHVAIKIIALGLLANETAVKRFEREANILNQLKHPNIVRYVGMGSYKKTPFFIMEYVDGESLDKILARRGKFSWDEVVVLGRQLCTALQHAHSKGIVHRDLKPSNLMILRDGTLKLTDFGIAKDADVTALTGANCTVGTAAYMSPEQCKGEKTLSAKSDLYSMGVVFYELLTGRKPFNADSPIEMFNAHVYSAIERPSKYVMDIPVWLDTLVCQLLEKKPEHRPYDAAMVNKVLEEVEQKVAELRSAGMDAALAKTTDRHAQRSSDETDRSVARTLRAAAAKKKLRRKSIPLASRKWFQAILLSAGLVAVVGFLIWFTRPANEETMYARAKAAVDARDVDKGIDATDRYLARFGSDSANPRVGEVREWNQSFWAQRREQQLHNRFNAKFNLAPEDDGQRMAFVALKRENSGDLEDARQEWLRLEEKFKDAEQPEPAVYAWVARKKLADLASVPKLEVKLQAALEDVHALQRTDSNDQLDSTGKASLKALRFEKFEDGPAARDQWERVRDDTQKDLAERKWMLLAADHARRLRKLSTNPPDKEREQRVALLQKRYDEAAMIPPTADPTTRKKAIAICRDIHDLYARDDDPRVRAIAAQAAQLMRERNWT